MGKTYGVVRQAHWDRQSREERRELDRDVSRYIADNKRAITTYVGWRDRHVLGSLVGERQGIQQGLVRLGMEEIQGVPGLQHQPRDRLSQRANLYQLVC